MIYPAGSRVRQSVQYQTDTPYATLHATSPLGESTTIPGNGGPVSFYADIVANVAGEWSYQWAPEGAAVGAAGVFTVGQARKPFTIREAIKTGAPADRVDPSLPAPLEQPGPDHETESIAGRIAAAPLGLGPAPALTYATIADFEDYVLGWDTDDANMLAWILYRSENDIDRLLTRASGVTTVRKLNPAALPAFQSEALSNATCAQAEYRIQQGEEFFRKDQYERVSGPQFSTEGRLSRIGPKVLEELSGSALPGLRLGGMVWGDGPASGYDHRSRGLGTRRVR